MSESMSGPKQMNLPFDAEERGVSTARVISLADHRSRAQGMRVVESPDVPPNEDISKALERQILEEVLAEAERLPWYK